MKLNLRIVSLFVVAALTGFYWGQGSVVYSDPLAAVGPAAESSAGSAKSSVPTPDPNRPFEADPRVKDANCVIDQPNPDHECTPGAIFPNATAADICVSGYSKTVRDVSESTKKKIYRMYNIPYPPEFGTYEIDHFVALTLGGSNDIANLWPFPRDPRPGFIEKDLTVNYLREKVCEGKISLPEAQRAITTYWPQVYNNMPKADKTRLEKKYPTWANRK